MLNNKSTYTQKHTSTSPTLYASQKVVSSVISSYLNLTAIRQLKGDGQTIEGKVPDVTGFDIATALKILEKVGLNVRIDGNGYVSSQSIPAGSTFKRGQYITLTLKS